MVNLEALTETPGKLKYGMDAVEGRMFLIHNNVHGDEKKQDEWKKTIIVH